MGFYGIVNDDYGLFRGLFVRGVIEEVQQFSIHGGGFQGIFH
jgi:hypothetical protein